MRILKVYFDNSMDIWIWLQPLLWCKKELRKRGFLVKFNEIPQFNVLRKNNSVEALRKIKKEDIVVLAYHHKSDFCKLPRKEREKIMKNIRENCNHIIWLDTSDSTGTCMFDIIPFVDVYLKKQLLKDKSLYKTHMEGQRFFVNYYVKKYGFRNCEDETECDCIQEETDLKKLDISWNIALWNNHKGGAINKIYRWCGIDCSPQQRLKIKTNKKYTIFFNGTVPDRKNALTFQRMKVIKLINDLKRKDCIAPKERLSRLEYIECMKDSYLIPSPFGWGEICNRDFEAFYYGGCLIKPIMDSIETFPDLFINGKTYIGLDWDFENFDDVIKMVDTVEGRKKIREISEKGQRLYQKYLDSNQKNILLAEHLEKIMEKHGIISY